MFKHFLVPLDGSKLAEMILPVTTALAKGLGAQVTLLHVVEAAAPKQVHGEPHLLNATEAQQYLDGIAERLRGENVQVDIHIDVAQGGVVKAIFAHGGELNADLILLTNHGHSGLREAVYGSIAQKVLQSGAIPVLLVKAEHAAPLAPYVCKKIFVPLDSSPVYEPALDVAKDLAGALEATLQLVVVVPTAQTLSPERAATGILLPTSTRVILDLTVNSAVDYLNEKLSELAAKDIQAEGQVLRGEIPAQILAAAQQGAADLIVMATHGRAGLDAFWSGSIAPKVLGRAVAPTLLLRVTGESGE